MLWEPPSASTNDSSVEIENVKRYTPFTRLLLRQRPRTSRRGNHIEGRGAGGNPSYHCCFQAVSSGNLGETVIKVIVLNSCNRGKSNLLLSLSFSSVISLYVGKSLQFLLSFWKITVEWCGFNYN